MYSSSNDNMASLGRAAPSGVRRWLAPALVACLFCALVTGGLLLAKPSHEAADQQRYHWPQIRHFMQQPFDGSPYPSWVQMTPGHHVALAWLGRLAEVEQGAEPPTILRLANALFGLALLLGCWWLFRSTSNGDHARAVLLCLPLAVSPYVLGSSIWIMSDNGALLWTVLSLALLCRPRPGATHIAAMACCITLAVLWRQTCIFLLLPLLVRARLAPATSRERYWLLLAAAPPLAALAWFVSLWGGLVPPAYHHEQNHINPAVLPYVLAVFGSYGVFYLGFLRRELRSLKSSRGAALVTATVLGALIASTFLPAQPSTRFDGILLKAISAMDAITGVPAIALLIPLTVAGALVMLLCCLRLLRLDATSHSFTAPVLLAFVPAWTVALTVSDKIYQRYFDPLLLVSLGVVAATSITTGRTARWGVALLAIALLLVSLVKLAGVAS